MPSRGQIVYCWSKEPAEVRNKVLTHYKFRTSCITLYNLETKKDLVSHSIKSQQLHRRKTSQTNEIRP